MKSIVRVSLSALTTAKRPERDHAFDGARQCHIDTIIRDAGNDAIIFLSDMVLHIFTHLELVSFPLGFISTAFKRRCPVGDTRQQRMIMLNPLFA